MGHKESTTIIERFQTFMEDEMGPGKLIIYGIASAGLFVALHRIRPFTKFKRPSDVPFHFLQSHIPLQGNVMRVEPSGGALLMINHQSLLPFPRFNDKSYLPIKIGGIDITGNGISWLQSVVDGKYVTFVPVAKEKDYLECVVIMPRRDQGSVKIGEELVRLGLGTVHEPWVKLKDTNIVTYKRSLVSAQKWAVRRRNGYWHFNRKPTFLWKTQMFIINKVKSLLPTHIVRLLDL